MELPTQNPATSQASQFKSWYEVNVGSSIQGRTELHFARGVVLAIQACLASINYSNALQMFDMYASEGRLKI
jgi:hypothetical protein